MAFSNVPSNPSPSCYIDLLIVKVYNNSSGQEELFVNEVNVCKSVKWNVISIFFMEKQKIF